MTTVRIWFTKTGEASYISLLDLQRVMQRSLKRSGLPVWYTLGFNPHIYMTFACPLPLGQESLVESVDVKTEAEQPDLAAWKAALEPVMPLGVTVTAVTLPKCKAEQIAGAVYTVLGREFARDLLAFLDRYFASASREEQEVMLAGLSGWLEEVETADWEKITSFYRLAGQKPPEVPQQQSMEQ